MKKKLWEFKDNSGTFVSSVADKLKSLYLPLGNEHLFASITPDLHGDIKSGQNSFLLTPVSRVDLTDSKSSRNFWVYLGKNKVWSATGVSKDLKQIKEDKSCLEAGLLWQKSERENKKIGLKAEILSFVPSSSEPVEIMRVKITNTSKKNIKFIPTAAIPIYGRGANCLRDHRHVTSLLQRVTLHKYGVIVKPTLAFDEAGHKPNKTNYFVLGYSQKFIPPQYLYPTQEMFYGDGGDPEAPCAVLNNELPKETFIQGKEAMGAFRFPKVNLAPRQSRSYIVLMGIVEDKVDIQKIPNQFNNPAKVQKAFEATKKFWLGLGLNFGLSTGCPDFDNWFRWVSIQPTLRNYFGCSFLPDFDYGKGGRGWRDLWQDCLSLILNDPAKVRSLLVNNFSGVRIDGSNATIICTRPLRAGAGFIADRNNISRVWMDHGVWPLLTLDLYLNETGDYKILFEQVPYFRNHEINRCRAIDYKWTTGYGKELKTKSGRIYRGTILEHLLVQNLVQFFNVGAHNHVRLEGGDWNDGLDMAKEYGESVTFSAMYANNLQILADLLLKKGPSKIQVAKELKILLAKINYNNIKGKLEILDSYFSKTKGEISGEKALIDARELALNLREKAEAILRHIRKDEWLKEGFFNGYYDNKKQRVEGRKNNIIRMSLTAQVFPILSGAADQKQIIGVLKSAKLYLFDKNLKGYHLNTDFRVEQFHLGRAFSFSYGDKENGAIFNHMVVMFAYALYKRGFSDDAWQVLSSIYKMASDTEKSKIWPCLPEYFDLSGRGMYAYLTGSASWFLLTILTQAFGVKGQDGGLLIEPKLTSAQFEQAQKLSINKKFAGRALRINFFNPKKLNHGQYNIVRAALNSKNLAVRKSPGLLLSRNTILSLPANKQNTLDITLG